MICLYLFMLFLLHKHSFMSLFMCLLTLNCNFSWILPIINHKLIIYNHSQSFFSKSINNRARFFWLLCGCSLEIGSLILGRDLVLCDSSVCALCYFKCTPWSRIFKLKVMKIVQYFYIQSVKISRIFFCSPFLTMPNFWRFNFKRLLQAFNASPCNLFPFCEQHCLQLIFERVYHSWPRRVSPHNEFWCHWRY
jgi:hypothetical protein